MADIKIYGTLKNATDSNRIAYSEQIFDSAQNKTQSEINAAVSSAGQLRLKVASWNIGGFSLGTSGDPTITPQTFDEMRGKWRQAINDLGMDLMLCCEYNTRFMDAQGGYPAVSARDAVFNESIFRYAEIGPEIPANKYMQTAIFSNIPLSESQIVYFTQSEQAGRYYQLSSIMLNGVAVTLISTHLDFVPGGSTPEETERIHQVRISQINELLDACANSSHAIICGDFNTNRDDHRDDFNLFINAGFNAANHGYLGDICTWPAGDGPHAVLDNVLCKGFTISKVGTLNDATLSDHICIYGDCTMFQN